MENTELDTFVSENSLKLSVLRDTAPRDILFYQTALKLLSEIEKNTRKEAVAAKSPFAEKLENAHQELAKAQLNAFAAPTPNKGKK